MISGADAEGEERGLGGARPGGARHQGPRGWRAHLDGRDDRCGQQERSTAAASNRAPFYMGTPVTRVRRRGGGRVAGCRPGPPAAFVGRCPLMVGLDVSRAIRAHRRRAARLVGGVLGTVTAGVWLVGSAAAHGSRRQSRPAWLRSCSAGRSRRCRRSASWPSTVWWIWAVRRVNTVHPTNRSRANGASRSCPGCWPSRSPSHRASSTTTRRCSRSTWSSTSCSCSSRRR